MITKSKRQENSNIRRLEAGGEIKEIIVKEDILNPENAKVHICFKGNISSGIIEISKAEAEDIQKILKSKLSLMKKIKVIR